MGTTPPHLQLHIAQQVLQAPRDVLGGLGDGLLAALRQPKVLHLQAQAAPVCRARSPQILIPRSSPNSSISRARLTLSAGMLMVDNQLRIKNHSKRSSIRPRPPQPSANKFCFSADVRECRPHPQGLGRPCIQT